MLGKERVLQGLDPIFISFAVRNRGSNPVSLADNISQSPLYQDLVEDTTDFYSSGFNLGGGEHRVLGLAGETINLTWFQQLG